MKSLNRLVVFGFLLFFATVAQADVTATVFGTVTDPSGQVVANAPVVLTNPTTGYRRTATTDSSGAFEFQLVPVGSGYRLEVTSSGFANFVQTDITLLVNQRFLSDVQLKVGGVSETVAVTANAVQIDSTSNQVGDLITDTKMTNLPLNGRSYTDLMGLQPGVVPTTSSAAWTDRPVSGGLNPGEVSVNGSQESGNAFLINGGDVQEPKNNGAAIIPSLDAIQEFRILTNTFDAEHGRFAGGIVNVITKSGTNEFHGSAYEFLRNEVLNAQNFFDQDQTDPSTGEPIPGTARGVFRRNQFGYSLGGPIVKNRLFFFSDYQGTREIRGMTGEPAFIPSTSEVNGDFSDVGTTGYGALTGIVQGDGTHAMRVTLSQRLGYTVSPGEPYWTPGCNTPADAQAGMCVFPGQVIPKAAWDPAAAGTIKFIPSPTGSRGGTPFFSTSAQRTTLNDDKIGERVNWNDPLTGDWSFYFSYDTTLLFNPFAGGNVPGFTGTVPQKAYQGNVSNTHIFSPTLVNEFRVNYTRSTIYQTQPSGEGLGPISSFGFSTSTLGLIPTVPSVEGMPSINIGGSYSLSMGVVAYGINQVNNTYQVADVVSKVYGLHSFKFGGEYRNIQVNEYNISTPNGSFSFDGSETGNSFADFLVGAPSGFAQQSYSTFFTRANYGGLFFQDTFRIAPNVTLNLGLRWEYIQPYYEKRGWLNAIDWGTQSTVFPGSPTGWIFPGDKGLPKTISKTPLDDFSPRVGINWSPGATEGFFGKLFGGPGKTSIRAGSGIYYQAIQDQPAFWTIGDAPFGLFYASGALIYLSTPYEDRRNDNDPGQRFPFTPPTPGQPVNWSTYLPIGGSPGVALNNVTPYIIQFNLNIQRELSKSLILNAGYVGTRGHHLLAQTESNPGIAATCLEVAAALPSGQGCGPHGEDQIYDLPDGTVVNGTRPHSVTSGRFLANGQLDFTSNAYNETNVNSDYNAFQASLTKHAGFGQFLIGYTFAKSIDNGSSDIDAVNPFNPHLSRSLSAFDMRHNFVASYQVDLPKLKDSSVVVRTLLGGWSVSGITRFTTGLPVTISQDGDRSLAGTGGIDEPNWDGKPIRKFDPRSSSDHAYFDASQFSLQPLGTFGSANRRFFSGPGINNWDVALLKVFSLGERFSLQFRAEYFNVFNHAQFNNPTGNQASASFGQVVSARDPRIGQIGLRLLF